MLCIDRLCKLARPAPTASAVPKVQVQIGYLVRPGSFIRLHMRGRAKNHAEEQSKRGAETREGRDQPTHSP